MKNLTDWFDRVFVINCKHRPDRLERVKNHLSDSGMADVSKVTFTPAIIGDWTTCPAGFMAGRGAWGCLRSHERIAEDVMHERDENGVMIVKNYLVLEDDVYFLENALSDLNAFMELLPEEWDQIYLGGQHLVKPVPLGNGLLIGIDVNRTHAYALNQRCFQPFYRHITFAPDYIGKPIHIDHQLGLAHRRRDWDVHCPLKWICGQESGSSNVSGRINDRNVWQP